MEKIDTKDTVSFTLRLPVDLIIRLDILAAKERKSRQRWIEEALVLVADRIENRDA